MDVRQTATFAEWLDGLRDRQARARIVARIRRMELGNTGDAKAVGEGIFEARIDYGPGYRLYFIRRGGELIILLCGGDKGGQRRDIGRAKLIAKEV